jgi:hypothetical protein
MTILIIALTMKIGAIGPIELITVGLIKLGNMIIVKDHKDHHVRYQLRMIDDNTKWGGDGWTTLGIFLDCPHRITPILYGLRHFSEEIREKIYNHHVYQQLEEQLVMQFIEGDLYRTLTSEHFRLFREKMEDFYQLVANLDETVNISMFTHPDEITNFLDETDSLLGNEI